MKTLIPLMLLTLMPCSVFADGLIYKLPDDGAWVTYDMTMKMTRKEQQRDAEGQLRMSSVGESTEDGVSCRWIEVRLSMKINNNERTIICKILSPETELKEGGDPVGKRIRGWIRMGKDAEKTDITDDNLGPMPVFLAKKMEDQKELPAIEIDSKLGKAECKGVSGILNWKERSADNKATVTVRRHPKAPFGVVSGDVNVDVTRNGAGTESLSMKLKLKDFGFDAKSELPDKN